MYPLIICLFASLNGAYRVEVPLDPVQIQDHASLSAGEWDREARTLCRAEASAGIRYLDLSVKTVIQYRDGAL